MCMCMCMCMCRWYVFTYVCHAIYQSDTGVRQKVLFLTQPLLPHPLKYNVERVLIFARELSKINRSAQHCFFGARGRNGFTSLPRALVTKQYIFLDRGVVIQDDKKHNNRRCSSYLLRFAVTAQSGDLQQHARLRSGHLFWKHG